MKAQLIIIKLFFIFSLFVTSCNDSDTSTSPPEVITHIANEVTAHSVIITGEVLSDGNSVVTNRGIYYSTTQDVQETGTRISLGNGLGEFSDTLINIIPETTYYVRAFAENNMGLSLGNEISFKTLNSEVILFNSSLNYGTLNDIDGNDYKTIVIGTQEWMAENLKVTHYNDGSQIFQETDNPTWDQLTSGAFCWYANSSELGNSYGALYNWYAINTDKLCPVGWHVPSDEEWTALSEYLGDEAAGGKLKEIGLQHWGIPFGNMNAGATNESGFTALPGGIRSLNGGFFGIGNHGNWWSSTETDASTAWYRYMGFDITSLFRNNWKKSYGKSVRCLKD